jgi:hypothetical protein
MNKKVTGVIYFKTEVVVFFIVLILCIHISLKSCRSWELGLYVIELVIDDVPD